MSRKGEVDSGWAATLMVGAVAALISLPGLLLAVPLMALVKRQRAVMLAALAIVGLGTTALLYPSITTEMEAALAAIRKRSSLWEQPEQALEAAWPHVRTGG
jgi:hypothetical protein